EVSNVVETSNQGPTTNKRSIKTTVLVEDGQILVLGGLIDDTLNESVQKVPGLGDVPVLGNLFRYRRTSKAKRNLMVFLHPVILRDNIQNTLYTNDKYSYIRTQQLLARQRGVALLPKAETPLLVPPEQVQENRTILNTLPPAPPPEAAVEPVTRPVVSPKPEPVFEERDRFQRFGFGNK
ncbi:MAG: type II secretion system protein GspD, partial [Candidatus Competibacteraceae bacterium]|nr:type II secretion system protein GspD [Candidatus Competibacteraceae bacterium]